MSYTYHKLQYSIHKLGLNGLGCNISMAAFCTTLLEIKSSSHCMIQHPGTLRVSLGYIYYIQDMSLVFVHSSAHMWSSKMCNQIFVLGISLICFYIYICESYPIFVQCIQSSIAKYVSHISTVAR